MAKGRRRRRRRRRRAAKRIPIPSFSCVSPASPPQQETKKDAVIAPNWNKSLLLRTETALHVNRNRRGNNSKWSQDGLLALDDFMSLVRQVALVEPTSSRQDDTATLSSPEKLLRDLVLVASPSLYNLKQKDGRWYLQMVDYTTGSRLEELQRLLERTTKVNTAKRDSIMESILENRRKAAKTESKQPVTSVVKKAQQKAIVEPHIHADMSLEDRVRARAEASRQQRERAATSKVESSTTVDNSSLLRLADAMWSHSRHIQRKQAQVLSPRASKSTTSRFCLTVQDFVRLFAGSYVVSSKASRTELLKGLRELQRLAPEWISFSSSRGELSKHTTVWLDPTVDYSSVRTKLGAPPSGKRPADESITTTESLVQTPSPPKKQRTTAAAAALKKLPAGPETPPRQSNALKRPAAQEVSSNRSPKKKKGLRINSHLILTDADYDGGMILEPSIDESPRGLKRLFSQMNSGQRI